jgi:hypothetical protein
VRYMLLICTDERSYDNVSAAEVASRTEAWERYAGELTTAGKMRGADRLRPTASATTVRVKGGERLLSDGPFAETKEQLGGYFIVEAGDLDEAIAWASKMPHLPSGGSVEVRPIWDME